MYNPIVFASIFGMTIAPSDSAPDEPAQMQPYMGAPQRMLDDAPLEPASPQWKDWLNLGIIAAGWLVLLLLLPPAHEYPVIDDWIYAGSVRDVMQTGRFVMPDWSQANLVGAVYWGVIWCNIFGFSFTTLTSSTLALSLAGLFAFYGIARQVGVQPRGALLGTGLLAFNPIFVHLSYSFMTDVPFLSLMLLSCFCYLRGMRTRDDAARGIRGVRAMSWIMWLVLGGLFAGWSFLVRQYGVLAPVAFVLYLILEGVRTRRWRWREMLVTVVVPGLVFGVWYIWSRGIPTTALAVEAANRAAAFRGTERWPRVTLLRAFAVLPLTAMCAWGAVKLKRWQMTLVPLILLGILVGMQLVDLPDETWLAQYEPPVEVRLGPLAYRMPNDQFMFGTIGNIIQVDAIDFDEFGYPQERVWSTDTWRWLWGLGVALGAALLAKMAISLWMWLKTRLRGEPVTPLTGTYLLGAMIFIISLAFPADLFDRYILAYIPFAILFVVRGSREWGRAAWTYSVVAFVLLALFTCLAKADHIDQQGARWQAGYWMEARTGAVRVGWNWNHWGHADSETYSVTGIHQDGWREEQRFPYTCRLCGFSARYVLAESRADMPALPQK